MIKKAAKVPGKMNFPARIIRPIAAFLTGEVKKLERRKKDLKEVDPFTDTRRIIDNAASDSEAAEQEGHLRVSALRSQVDKRLIQLRKALTRIKLGRYGICEKCGRMIDTDRLMIMPEATICVHCEKKKE